MKTALFATLAATATAAEDAAPPRALYQVRPATRGVKLAEPARASSVLSKILDWTAAAAPKPHIAGTKLRPRASETESLALAEVAAKNFNDPAYCADGVGIKILAFEGLEQKDWFSSSDPYAKLTAETAAKALVPSKKGKDHPETQPLSNTQDKKDWNQFFCFPSGDVESIKVEIWDKDSWSSDDKMGEIVVRRAAMAEATQAGGRPFELSSTGSVTLRFKLPAKPAPVVTAPEEMAIEKAEADAAQAEADRLAALAEETRAAAEAEEAAAKKAELEKEASEKLAAAEAAKQKAAAAKAKWGKLSGGVNAASALNGAADDAATAKAEHQAKVSEAAGRAKGKLAGGLAAARAFNGAAADAASGKPFAWACDKRIRKDYRDLSPEERALYWKAAQKAKDTPAGGESDAEPGNNLYDTFVMIHAWRTNKPQAHSTSAFLPWHRKFLVEFESMLRSLGDEFRCITIPYWDWSQNAEMCAQDPTCVTWHHNDPVLQDSGGPGRKDGKTHGRGTSGSAFGGRNQPGGGVGCMSDASPFKDWVDHNGKCLSRGYDWDFGTDKEDRKGPLVSYRQLMDTIHHRPDYGTSGGFRVGLEGFPHNTQHNMLGGHMRSLESPADPIFFMHHCMVDRIWAIWQDCHDHDAAGKDGSTRAEYQEYGTQRGYFETGIDAKLLYNHPYHRGKNSEIIPTWDDKHFTPRDYHSSTDMKDHVDYQDRSVVYAEDEMQKIMRELDRKVCNFDTHQNALLEVGQGKIMERVHVGTKDGALIEKACAEIRADIEEAEKNEGGTFSTGLSRAITKQCERENAKAFGEGKPAPLHIRFIKRWFSPGGDATAFQDIQRDAPELLLPRCALFEGDTFADKQEKMRAAIDQALAAMDEDAEDDKVFAAEEQKNDDDMEETSQRKGKKGAVEDGF
jgi:hypothetical protein